jgi:hypothetical protein
MGCVTDIAWHGFGMAKLGHKGKKELEGIPRVVGFKISVDDTDEPLWRWIGLCYFTNSGGRFRRYFSIWRALHVL